MPGIRKTFKSVFRTGAGGQQKQHDFPPAASSSRIMPENPSATVSLQLLQEQFEDSIPSTSPDNPQQPPTAQSLWDKAYAALTREMPDLVKRYEELFANEERMAESVLNETTLSQLTAPHDLDIRTDRSVQVDTVTQRGLRRMEDMEATHRIAGFEIVLADQITKAANFLLWGKELIGSTVKESPEADGFAYVTSRMHYYVALEPVLYRLRQNTRVDEALMSAADDHLVGLYQSILEFQLRSVLRVYNSRVKTYVHDIAPSRDWEKLLLDIKTREDTVNSDLKHINQLLELQELERLHNTSEDRKCLQLFCLTQNGNGATYDWYKSRVDSRVEGTCEWLLEHPNFKQWLSQKSGPLLVSADPGCGKSVLAKYLVDRGLAPQSATICYFFFKDQDQNTIRQALCALLHQLFSQEPSLIQHAMELYNKMGAALVQSEESLWTILRAAVRDPQAGSVIFVIDALDECDESQLRSLIANLEDMFRNQQLANAKFKVLMTSRPYEQVVRGFISWQDKFPRIHIPGEEEFKTISHDINSVIHHRVEQLAKTHRLSENLKSSLARKMLAIDHRTYLWVHLVFDYLDKGFEKTDDGIDAVIQTLPKSVNQAYDQMLNRSQKDGTAKTVKKVLGIILAARRPLTLSEMRLAIKLNGQVRGRSIYGLDLEQDVDFKARLRTLCGLFVNVHNEKIYFFHQTAREFLVQSSVSTTVSSDLQWHHSITIRDAHAVLAQTCMFYLDLLNSTDTETFLEGDPRSALFQYSFEYWGSHCREAEFGEGSAMVDLASGLCTPDLTRHSKWATTISSRYHIRPESPTSVLVSSRLGLIPVTELLLSRGADIEAKDSRGWTALMIAAESGHGAVIRLLLDNGADVKASNDDGTTALMIAAESGHDTIAWRLLKNGADVEAKDGAGMTALLYAAGSGHEAVTRLLLENHADVKARDDDGTTALMVAAEFGHEEVARLLLKNGADIKARDSAGMTALFYAAKSGHEAVTGLLFEKGADVEAKRSDGGSALMLAAASGHEAVTRLLLQKGADVEARDAAGIAVLLYAAESGHEDVIGLLLKKGVNVKARDVDGRSALMIAAESGHKAVSRLLLRNGADVEVKKNGGSTALMIAAQSGHEAVTRLLLMSGADIKARDDDGRTALMYAARFGSEAATRLLLDIGADVEVKDDDGMTALLFTAKSGHEAVTQLLLANRADIKTRDDDGMTALMFAADSGHEAVSRLLIANGANVEAKDDDGWTALIYAARFGHEAVTRLLLEKGADTEARDKKGWTAQRNAPETTRRLLLDNGAQVEVKDVEGDVQVD